MAQEYKCTKRNTKGDRVIIIPINQSQYSKFMQDTDFAQKLLESRTNSFPQIFPEGMRSFIFNGSTVTSEKMKLKKRKIIVDGIHYQLHPSFVLPAMRGIVTDEIANALLLCAHGVPFWLVSRYFGKNETFWFRLYQSFSVFFSK